jgi:hypothetical protein
MAFRSNFLAIQGTARELEFSYVIVNVGWGTGVSL